MMNKNKLILGLTSLIIVALIVTIAVLASKKNKDEVKIENKDLKELTFGQTLNLRSDGMASTIEAKQNLVIKDKAKFDELLKQISTGTLSQDLNNSVDFNNTMVIAVFSGQKSSGGHEIEIKSITEKDNKIEVKAIDKGPGSDCMTTTAITSPYHIVNLEKSDNEVTFSIEPQTIACSK